jgi:hypothetical protein
LESPALSAGGGCQTSVYLYQEIHTYQGMNITGVTGLTANVATLKSLGAVEV